MKDTIKLYWPGKILVGLFLFFTLWWLYLTFLLQKSSDPLSPFGLFGNLYGLIAAWSAIVGFIISKRWGGWKSLMGRAIIMFSLGLLFQEFGQIAYSYYIFVQKIEIPYPSLGDIGFFGTIPFYIYGSFLLAHASGVKFSMRSISAKVQALIIPVIVLTLAYLLILHNYSFDRSAPLATFLNYGYPTGQAIYITIVLLTYLLTRNILGGIMKSKIILILIAFCAQFIADYAFIIFHNYYYPGSILDYLYVAAYFLMGFGIFQLDSVLNKIKGKD